MAKGTRLRLFPIRMNTSFSNTVCSLRRAYACALVAGLTGLLPLQAEVKLPAIFGDNMVLQQDMKVPVWGTAEPGEKVTVIFGDHSGTAIADDKGKWRIDLAPLAVS